MKFVIVGFDGMRPDMVGPEHTPNLAEFAAQGCRFEDHRCTFPSETYVNTTSLLTGAHPGGHGLVANVFSESQEGLGTWFQGWEVESSERLQRTDGQGLFLALSAGEILGRTGRRMAAISTNSAGSARLMHHRVDKYDHLNFCPHSVATSSPSHRAREIAAEFELPAEKEFPDLAGLSAATDIFLDHLVPGGLPDLTFLWYGEPDNTYHLNGIGSPPNLQAIRHADSQLGRVLEWWRDKGRGQGVQLLVASDHGHLTLRDRVSVSGYLERAGFRVDTRLTNGAQVAMLPRLSTNLLVKDGDPGLLRAVVAALQEAEWLGSLFHRPDLLAGEPPEGVFPLDLVLADCARSPHLAWTFLSDDEDNRWGWPGRCVHNIDLPLGGSMHGGLHPREMRCLLAAGGDLFRQGHQVANPTCIIDILPTILRGLEIEPPESVAGRVLEEALDQGPGRSPEVEREELRTRAGGYRQYLKRVRVDGRVYLAEGGRSD